MKLTKTLIFCIQICILNGQNISTENKLFKMTSPKPSFTFYRVNGWPGPDDSDLLKFEFPTTKAANQSSIERRIQTVESSTLRQPKITSIQLTTPKSTVHLSTIHHSTVLHSTVLLSTGHLSTGHLSTGHPSIGHHSTVHHSTVHQPILRQSTLHQSTETTSSHSPVRQMKCVLFEDRLPQQTLELFSCNQMSLFGYYADVSSNCQEFHICSPNGVHAKLMCPKHTQFNQKTLNCDWIMNVDCKLSTNYFHSSNEQKMLSWNSPH